MLYHTALPSLYSSTELLPHTGTLRLDIGSGGSRAAAVSSHRATVELSRRATLTAVVGPSYCSVTNLGTVAVAVAVAVARHPGIVWNQSFVGHDSGEVQSISPSCSTYLLTLSVLIDAGTKLIVLCRLVLPPWP
jgi:hypothetical protein